MKKQFGKFVALLGVVMLLMSACLPVIGDPLAKYNGLIQSYQDARKAAATSQTCFAVKGQELIFQLSAYNSYLTATVTNTAVYNSAFKTVSSAGKAYVDANGQPIPSNQLDLGKLAQQNATPANELQGFTVIVNAFTEAPLAQIDPSALANTQRLIDEAFNQIMSCADDWNTAVETYNTDRNQVSGDIVGSIADRLGVKDLPESLPYYTPPLNSANPFNMAAPTLALPTP